MKIFKKWWFWLISIIAIIVAIMAIKFYIEDKKAQEGMETIVNSMADYVNGIETAEGYLDKFNNNYDTETWLDKYKLIKEGMTRSEVEEILGEGYENDLPSEEDEFFLSWGVDRGLKKGQDITIWFKNNIVYMKTQIGLE